MSLPLPARAQRTLLRGIGRVPSALIGGLRRFSTVNAAGDRLDPAMAAVCFATDNVPGMGFGQGSVEHARRGLDESGLTMAEDQPPLAVEQDIVIDGPGGSLGLTRYRADTSSSGIVLFFHGGGFSIGSRVSHDPVARRLAVTTGADVVSVEYRLAPEHPFPAATDDALAAWRYVVDAAPGWGVSPEKIVVAGDSAGANLGTVLAQDLRTEAVTPALQVLIYPVTDVSSTSASRLEFAEGFFLTEERLEQFTERYVPEVADRKNPRVSPLLTEDLTGMPPAYVIVAGFDPLRDEGLAYADALRDAGVPVVVDRVGSMIHGFINMLLISETARRAADRMSAAIVDALA